MVRLQEKGCGKVYASENRFAVGGYALVIV